MAKGKRKWWFILGLPVFIIFVFTVPHPVEEETVLSSLWINSPLSSSESSIMRGESLIPFILGDRFGYVGESGRYTLNRVRDGYVSISDNFWTEYETLPSRINIMNPAGDNVLSIDGPRGYPLFLDNRIFIVGSEQNSVMELSRDGRELWSYDFPGPITCVDAQGGYFLAGTLDGAVILLDSRGRPVFTPFEPGGSNLPIILGCAISEDASLLAIISGINEQRFLLMERTGDNFRVVYHEFLGSGFRRPVHISFIDNDSKVAFEREGGMSIYTIGTRRSININIKGEVVALDKSGLDGYLFVITSGGEEEKSLVTIRYPGQVVGVAPFYGRDIFLSRQGSALYLGGDSLMAMFEIKRR
ncbi:MAG: WD40 repeat domain-containing protein [Treponema sp.]|nr:WD40 repeat domain-containing protein [Treponema sp.]